MLFKAVKHLFDIFSKQSEVSHFLLKKRFAVSYFLLAKIIVVLNHNGKI